VTLQRPGKRIPSRILRATGEMRMHARTPHLHFAILHATIVQGDVDLATKTG
jgi:hypothetical protein